MNKLELVRSAQFAESESTYIDFKSTINWSSLGDQLEIIKDIIAFANSGGGCIVIGINDDGKINSDYEYKRHEIDPANITNKIRKYTGIEFGDIDFIPFVKNDKTLLCVFIAQALKPIVFEKPGTYPDPKDPAKLQKTAFGQGTVYFRHGSKSETCNSNDLSLFIDRALDHIRDSWLGNIRKVVEAPVGHIVHMLPPNVIMKETDDATPIRITDDNEAPAYKIEHPDLICPYRQKDLLGMLNEYLTGKERINQYDLQAITTVYKIDNAKPDLFYKSLFGPKQYSLKFKDWIIERFNNDNEFFIKTRDSYKKIKNSLTI